VVCDYCGSEFSKPNKQRLKSNEVVNKDSCFKCRFIKRADICEAEHGVRNHSQKPETRKILSEKTSFRDVDKMKNAMIEKYGVANGYLTKHSIAEKYKGFVCRSKYEKSFVDFAEKFGYVLSVPERIKFEYEGRSRYYYPDFYIEDFDLIVEIKSDWTWKQQLDLNIAKMVFTIQQGYDIVFLDEEHGINNEKLWSELDEYLRSFRESC
jgi:hypothetical protein